MKIKIAATSIAITLAFVITVLNLRNPQKELHYVVPDPVAIESEHFQHVLGTLMGPPFVDGNQIRALYNGDEIFPAMLDAIKSAKKTITFESYIYWSGYVGEMFANTLAEKAKSGVKVHVLIDWVGSQRIEESYIERMRNAGVEVERYHALRWYNVSRMNNRTHRKLLIVDGRIGFTGGVGIADEWGGNGLKADRWRDTHYEARGPIVHQMQATFMDNWLKVRPEVRQSHDYFPDDFEAHDARPKPGALAQMFKSSSREGGSSVRIMYLLAIAGARRSINIESAYFVPDDTTIEALVAARKRGVDVELIVPGELTDSLVVRHASREQWGDLLEAGVKIYEYKPAMFHCKVLVIDGLFVSIGSTNFDERSFRLNDEANLNVLDRDFAAGQIRAFEKDRERSQLVTLESWQARPWHNKLTEKAFIVFRSQF